MREVLKIGRDADSAETPFLPSLARLNETMGTRGTDGTNFFALTNQALRASRLDGQGCRILAFEGRKRSREP